MKKICFLLFTLLLSSCAGTNEVALHDEAVFRAMNGSQTNYLIGYGDVLYISVWKEEALTRQVIVLPDGKITFPLIGEIRAYGKTVRELKDAIEKKLDRYMSGVTLSVEVVHPNSMTIYVIGKVNSPGSYQIQQNITVMQALTLARGLNPFADKNGIKIIRNVDGRDHQFTFDYDAVAGGKSPDQNIALRRGDMIIVP